MRVLDASAVVELLMGRRRGQRVVDLLSEDSSGLLSAPDLLDVDVAQALRRLVGGGVMTTERAAASLDLLGRLPLDRRPARVLLPRIWELRDGLSAHDAAYVALAEVLGCPLVTCDARLAAASGHTATVLLAA